MKIPCQSVSIQKRTRAPCHICKGRGRGRDWIRRRNALHSLESTASSSAATKEYDNEYEYDIEILYNVPKCFLVHNFLSPQECDEYISRIDDEIANTIEISRAKEKFEDDDDDIVNDGDDDGGDDSVGIRRSSAPQVSLQLSRLWPLPFLCLGAGIPPVVRLILDNEELTSISTSISALTMNQILAVALPNISIAFLITLLSTVLITRGMTSYAKQYTRTSQSLALNQDGDVEFIRKLVDRASDVVMDDKNASTKTNASNDDDEKMKHFSWKQFEAPVITKYDEGALFASHNDASPTRGSEWSDSGGQRIATVIIYLNDCPNGGGTKFDALNFVVQPKKGTALVFYPSDWNTYEADGRTIHQSLPAVETKYIVQLFGRCNRVPPPLGIPDSYGP